MEHVRWDHRPPLHDPIVIAAFEGWNDAGDAATIAAKFVRSAWSLRPFAEIDPEEFFDFTTARPQVRLVDGVTRHLEWPENRLWAGTVDGGPDVIVLVGSEPHLRWRTFCHQVTDLASSFGTRLVVTLGALLADVPHTRPVPLVGTAYDPEVINRLGLERSTYEGPTGIVGVLHDACRAARLPSASLWAAVPTYVPGAPSPKAALALVERVADLLGVKLDTTDLEISAASYERQVSELIDDDEDLAGYVRRLEEQVEDVELMASGDDLVADIEEFLRERGDD